MDKLKRNIDKIVGVLIIVLCVAMILKTHLGASDDVISCEDVDRAVSQVENALKNNPPPAVEIEDKVAIFEQSMLRSEKGVSGKLCAWKFFVTRSKGLPPPADWTVKAVYASPEDAGKIVEVLRDRDHADISQIGSTLLAGRFYGNSKKSRAVRDLLVGLNPAPVSADIVRSPDMVQPVQAVFTSPTLKKEGEWVGKGRLKVSLAVDSPIIGSVLEVLRSEGGAKEQRFAYVVFKAGEKPEIILDKIAAKDSISIDEKVLTIIEKKLVPRVKYNYRVRQYSIFHRSQAVIIERSGTKAQAEVILPDKKFRVMIPEIAKLLECSAKARVFSQGCCEPVALTLPSGVQIMYSGMGNFSLRKTVEGRDSAVKVFKSFKIGDRITHTKSARIKINNVGKVIEVKIDSEVVLVKLLKKKVVVSKGLSREIGVALVKDVRSGKEYRIMQPYGPFKNRPTFWWPKVALEEEAVVTPATGDGGSTRRPKVVPSTGNGRRPAPVKTSTVPNPTETVTPVPKSNPTPAPVTPGAEGVRSRTGSTEVIIPSKPDDPGVAPSGVDPKFPAWLEKKKAYDDWEKKYGSGR
jgi:hypothetical protein